MSLYFANRKIANNVPQGIPLLAVFAALPLKKLYQPYPADLLEIYPVSTAVNNVKNDSPECSARI